VTARALEHCCLVARPPPAVLRPQSLAFLLPDSGQLYLAAVGHYLPAHCGPARHTFVASVALIQLDTTVPLEESLIPHGVGNPERSEVLEQTHEPDTSRKTQCIRYSIRLLDKAAPNSGGADLCLIDRGLICAHPKMPGMAVRASF